VAKRDLFAPIKIDTMKILLNRSGKAGGHLGEVRRGVGEIVSAKYKDAKHKKDWSKES